MVSGHVWRVEFGQDGDLLNDILHLIFGILNIDYLDRDRFPRLFIDTVVLRSYQEFVLGEWRRLNAIPFINPSKASATWELG
jgi:hypothetical protein